MPKARFHSKTCQRSKQMRLPTNGSGKTVVDFLASEKLFECFFPGEEIFEVEDVTNEHMQRYSDIHTKYLDIPPDLSAAAGTEMDISKGRLVVAKSASVDYIVFTVNVTNTFWIQPHVQSSSTTNEKTEQTENVAGTLYFTMIESEQIPKGMAFFTSLFNKLMGQTDIRTYPQRSPSTPPPSSSDCIDGSGNENGTDTDYIEVATETTAKMACVSRILGGYQTEEGKVVVEESNFFSFSTRSDQQEKQQQQQQQQQQVVSTTMREPRTFSFSHFRAILSPDKKSVMFESYVDVEVRLAFSKTLLKILPVSLQGLEKRGSGGISKMVIKGAKQTIVNVEDAYPKWLESVGA